MPVMCIEFWFNALFDNMFFSSASVEQYSRVGKDFAVIFAPHWPKTSPSTPGPVYLQVVADSAPYPKECSSSCHT